MESAALSNHQHIFYLLARFGVCSYDFCRERKSCDVACGCRTLGTGMADPSEQHSVCVQAICFLRGSTLYGAERSPGIMYCADLESGLKVVPVRCRKEFRYHVLCRFRNWSPSCTGYGAERLLLAGAGAVGGAHGRGSIIYRGLCIVTAIAVAGCIYAPTRLCRSRAVRVGVGSPSPAIGIPKNLCIVRIV